MTELTRQHHHGHAWVGAALEDALDRDSPILSWFKAGELPALHDIADGLQADLEGNYPDRGIVLIAAVYLMLGDLLFSTDAEKSDRAAIVFACRELGSLGAWLVDSRPRTLQGVRALLHLSCWILEARERDPGLALAQGPAEKLLALALGALSENPFRPASAAGAG